MAPKPSGYSSASNTLRGGSLVARIFIEQEAGSNPSPDHVSRLHTLNARPFNNLGFWAYLAFAFVCLAMLTVFSYLIYSCYHSSKEVIAKRYIDTKNAEPTKMEDDGVLKIMSPNHTGKRLRNTLKLGKRVGAVGEKMRVHVGKTFLEMKGFKSGGNNHRRQESESEQNIMHTSNASQTSISYTNESTYDLDNHYLTSPAIAHTSDRAATYIPFHLPPPPPSPTPAHKEHIVRQYRGRAQLSPVSPSPSFSPASIPPCIPPGIIAAGLKSRDQDKTKKSPVMKNDDNKDESSRGRNVVSSPEEPALEESLVPEFDSHNIRFVSPLNPFMTPSTSTVMIWNDPKLSPINGSIITSNNAVSSTPKDPETSFPGIINAALKNVTQSPKILIKDILPRVVVRRHAEEDKENINPFEQGC